MQEKPAPWAGASARITIGGTETNVAIGLSRLGIGALWLGRVGDDAIGEALLAALRAEDVEVAVEVGAQRATGLMVKESRVPGACRVTYDRSGSAASAMSPELLRPDRGPARIRRRPALDRGPGRGLPGRPPAPVSRCGGSPTSTPARRKPMPRCHGDRGRPRTPA